MVLFIEKEYRRLCFAVFPTSMTVDSMLETLTWAKAWSPVQTRWGDDGKGVIVFAVWCKPPHWESFVKECPYLHDFEKFEDIKGPECEMYSIDGYVVSI